MVGCRITSGLVAGDCVSNVAWTAGNFPQLASDALSIVGDCNSDNQTERFEPQFRRRRDGILSLVNGSLAVQAICRADDSQMIANMRIRIQLAFSSPHLPRYTLG